MKIYNKIVIEWNDETQSYDKVVYEDSYEYDGELMLAEVGCPRAELDGIDHEWVVIGPGLDGQCWLKKNLETGIYSDGSGPISYGESDSDWEDFGENGTGAYSSHPNIEGDWGGYLYNWHAVMDVRGICPIDDNSPQQWYIPSHDDWTILEMELCMTYGAADLAVCQSEFSPTSGGWVGTVEGRVLKESGLEHWSDSGDANHIGTNEVDFTALPASKRNDDGGFSDTVGNSAYFWSSTITDYSSVKAWFRQLSYTYTEFYRGSFYGFIGNGFSVRCAATPITIWYISVTAGDNGNVLNPDGNEVTSWNDYYPDGMNLSIEAVPDAGYAFAGWGSSEMTLEIAHIEGWNIVGLPLSVADASYDTLFPDAINGSLYRYDDNYYAETELIAGTGYWLRFTDAGSTEIIGETITSLTISLSEEWNLITGISFPVAVEDIVDPAGIIVPGAIFGFDVSYFSPEVIEPGKGYWIRASADGDITISGNNGAVNLENPLQLNLIENIDLYANFNAIPTANPQSVDTDEDEPIIITLTGLDTDDDNLQFQITTYPVFGSLSSISGTDCSAVNTCTAEVEYTPDSNFNGVDSFVFQVFDGVSSNQATVNINVASVIDYITITSPEEGEAMEINEDNIINQQIEWTYTGPGDIAWTITSDDPSHVSSTISSTGLMSLQPAADWHGGPVNITINAVTEDTAYNPETEEYDPVGSSDSVTFTLTVNSVNDPPVLTSIGNQTTDEDIPLTITLSATDVEGSAVIYSASSDNANVTPTVAGTSLTLSLAENWNGVANITVTVTENPNLDNCPDSDNPNSCEDSETFQLTVNAVNDPPVAVAECANCTAGEIETDIAPVGTTDIDLVGSNSTDVDSTITEYVWKRGAVILNPNGEADLTVQLGIGTHSLTLKVTDAEGLSEDPGVSIATLTIIITPNQYTVTANITIDQAAEDQDHFELDHTEFGTVNGYDPFEEDFAYGTEVTLNALGEGYHAFSYWNADESSSNPTYTFTVPAEAVTVTANFVPVEYSQPVASFTMDNVFGYANLEVSFTDMSYATEEGVDTTIDAWSWDFGDGGASTDQNPIHTYSTLGTYNPELTVTDSNNQDATFVYTTGIEVGTQLSLTPIGDQTINENENIVIDLAAEGYGVVFSAVNANEEDVTMDLVDNANGTGTLSLTPDNQWWGDVSVTVTVNDGYGWSVPNAVSDTFTLTVVEVNDPPVAVLSIVTSAPYRGGDDIDLSGADSSDPEGTALTFQWGGDLVDLLDDDESALPSFTAPIPDPPNITVSYDVILTSDYLGVEPITASFQDTSTTSAGSTTSWSWDFGDGDTSTEQNPTHIYENPGTYSATLTVGTSDIASIYTLQLEVTDSGDSVGENKQSDDAETTISILNAYSATISESDETEIVVSPHVPPTAELSTSIDYLIVTFEGGTSAFGTTGEISFYEYNFGDDCIVTYDFIEDEASYTDDDGNVSQTCDDNTEILNETSFRHTYTPALNPGIGTYLVLLTVTDETGEFNITAPVDIDVKAIDVDFTADLLSGIPPHEVDFTDLSQVPADVRAMESWTWDLDDGATSTDQNPTHIYNAVGLYTISLTVTSDDGYVVTTSMADFISVLITQSTSAQFSPWQGINIIGEPGNSLANIIDLDSRPNLGMFYWDDVSTNQGPHTWVNVFLDIREYGFPNWPEEKPESWYNLICYDTGLEEHTPDYDKECQYEDQPCTSDTSFEAECIYENDWSGPGWSIIYSATPSDEDSQFSPDADARLVSSIENDIDATLVQYYDRKLSPDYYTNSTAPANVQFMFYLREPGNVFTEREIKNITNHFYIAWINWDDGSPLEYESPVLLEDNQLITHSYENWGVYNITGYMIWIETEHVYEANEVYYRKFFFNINLNKSIGYTDEFESVGGDNYTYIPYNDITPVIGGISDNSLYYRTIEKLADDFVDDDGNSYMDRRDDLRSQIAFNNIDDRIVGPELQKFVGTYNIGAATIYDDSGVEFPVDSLKGFFQGDVQPDGSITNEKLIHYGYGRTAQELGDHLGDVDIGQVRLFTTGLLDMWQMLGFENSDAGIPNHPRYWKNIIPEGYLLSDRDGVNIGDGEIGNIDEESFQNWNLGSNDEMYYYPVLPKLNKFGKFDEELGLQNDNNISYIPFGSLNREWDKDDETAPITNLNIEDPNLLIDFDFSSILNGVLGDNSGNENIGVLLNDFKVKLDSEVHPNSIKFPNRAKLEKKSREQPF
jgi:uncharacterized protein (TIGR02145 family)